MRSAESRAATPAASVTAAWVSLPRTSAGTGRPGGCTVALCDSAAQVTSPSSTKRPLRSVPWRKKAASRSSSTSRADLLVSTAGSPARGRTVPLTPVIQA